MIALQYIALLRNPSGGAWSIDVRVIKVFGLLPEGSNFIWLSAGGGSVRTLRGTETYNYEIKY